MVIPVRDNAGSLAEVIDRCVAVLAAADRPWEVLVVDDASVDCSWEVIRRAHAEHRQVRGIRLARPAGQIPAFYFAAAEAVGDTVVSVDADLESFPEDIPTLLERVDAGHDVVSGARPRRGGRAPVRRLGSIAFLVLCRRVLRIPFTDPGCGLKAFDRELVAAIVARGAGSVQGLRAFGALGDLAVTPDEVPVQWRPSDTASRHRWRGLALAVLDLARVSGRLRRRDGAALVAVGVLVSWAGPGGRARPAAGMAVASGLGLVALATVADRAARRGAVVWPVVRERLGPVPGRRGPG